MHVNVSFWPESDKSTGEENWKKIFPVFPFPPFFCPRKQRERSTVEIFLSPYFYLCFVFLASKETHLWWSFWRKQFIGHKRLLAKSEIFLPVILFMLWPSAWSVACSMNCPGEFYILAPVHLTCMLFMLTFEHVTLVQLRDCQKMPNI